jgi:hypothetical protein
MRRARLVWHECQKEWLREEIAIVRWYAQITQHRPDRKAIYVYEVAMLQAVQRTLDDLLYPPEVAIWTRWAYLWSMCWISMLADRENPDGMAFRRLITDERNERLAALPPSKTYRPTYITSTLHTHEGHTPSKDHPYGTY